LILSKKNIAIRLTDLKKCLPKLIRSTSSPEGAMLLVEDRNVPLVNQRIIKALSNGRIIIAEESDREHIPERWYNPKKLLGPYFLNLEIGKIKIPESPGMLKEICIDFSQPESLKERFEIYDKERVFLHPNLREFLRIETRQFLGIPTDLVAQVTIKREFARYGLEIIGEPVFLQPGFIGRIELNIRNCGNRPIALFLGLPIFQAMFELLSSCADIAH